MADGFSLDTIFLSDEEEADKVCPVAGGRACVSRGSIEGMLDNEELDISEEEKMVGGVDADPALFSWA